MRRWNPEVGTHPDLFEGKTPIFKPLSELTEEQVIELPRRAFNFDEWQELTSKQKIAVADNDTMSLKELMNEDFWDSLTQKGQEVVLGKMSRGELIGTKEWDALDDYDRERFIENDPESEELIDAVVRPFEQAYKSTTEPSDSYVLDNLNIDYFNSWLQEHADELVEMARNNRDSAVIDEIVQEHVEEGYSEEQVLQAIDEAMREVDNYDVEVGHGGFFVDSVNTGGYLSVDAPWKEAENLSSEELQIAIKKINDATDDVFTGSRRREITAENLTKKNHTFEAEWETEGTDVAFDPNWRSIARAVSSALEDIEPEDGEGVEPKEKLPEKPLEERIVHRFKDGSFVVELLPLETVEEGAPYVCDTHGHFYPPGELFAGGPSASCPTCKMGSPRSDTSLHMCIGAPSQRYVKAVKKGAGKAWSLRTAGGKKKLAIFADLTPSGDIRRIDQVKGKMNRLPGFEASKHGGGGREGKFKPIEVVQAAEFIASLGIDPYSVKDIALGMRVAVEKTEGNPEVKKAVETLKHISPDFAENLPQLVEAVEARKRLGARSEEDVTLQGNPPRHRGPCRHCGGERGGFCA